MRRRLKRKIVIRAEADDVSKREIVIPAKAGVQCLCVNKCKTGPRFPGSMI